MVFERREGERTTNRITNGRKYIEIEKDVISKSLAGGLWRQLSVPLRQRIDLHKPAFVCERAYLRES